MQLYDRGFLANPDYLSVSLFVCILHSQMLMDIQGKINLEISGIVQTSYVTSEIFRDF